MGQNLSGNDDIGRQDYVFKLTGGREISCERPLGATAALDGGSQPVPLTANKQGEKEAAGDEELRWHVVGPPDGIRNQDLSCAYFSKSSRLYSSLTALREICRFRSLAIFRRSESVGARDSRLNLAKSRVAGVDVLPNSRSNHPIVSSRTDRGYNTITMNLGVKGTVPLHLFESLPPHGPRDAVRMSVRAATEFSETLCRLAISASTDITSHSFSGVFILGIFGSCHGSA
jgi:hypothetical protein